MECGTENAIDVFLLDADANKYNKNKDFLFKMLVNITNTIAIDIDDPDIILSRVMSAKQSLFTYFQCIELNAILMVLFIAYIISLIITSITHRFDQIFTYFFYIFIMFLSKSIHSSLKPQNSYFARAFIGFWLLFVTYLSILFGSYLLDYMITPIPHAYIDSWDDLYRWTHLRIFTSDENRIHNFAETETTEMAINFGSRIDILKIGSVNELINYAKNALLSKNYVGVLARPVILRVLAGFLNDYPQLLSTMYVSRYGGGNLPHFLLVNTRIGYLLDSLNKM